MTQIVDTNKTNPFPEETILLWNMKLYKFKEDHHYIYLDEIVYKEGQWEQTMVSLVFPKSSDETKKQFWNMKLVSEALLKDIMNSTF